MPANLEVAFLREALAIRDADLLAGSYESLLDPDG